MAALKRPGIVVAAHSHLDGDAVCRFLEQHETVEVLAEVRSASLLTEALAAHGPAVLVLAHRLPDMPAHPIDFLRNLPIPKARIIYILPDSVFDRSVTVGLRQAGVRHVLRGAFTGSMLLQSLAAALPPQTLIVCRRMSGSLGQSTVALGLFLYSHSQGAPAHLLDRSVDGLLRVHLASHPILGPKLGRFVLDSAGPILPWPALTIVDGPTETAGGVCVGVLAAPTLRRQTTIAGDVQVANAVLGRCHPMPPGALALPRLRLAPVDLLVAGRPLPAPVLAPFRDLFHRLRIHEVTASAAAEPARPGGDL